MICLSVSRSPHASARPSSVASISTRRACATSLKHSSPCPPRPTASPPPTSPLGCAFSANKAFFRTAPATLPTISKNSAANRSFSGSPALAGTTHSRPAFAQWPPSWCFATKPSNPCSLPLNLSAQLAARTTRDPSTPTTVPYRLPCTASFTSSALPLEYRQFFCRASPLSAYGAGGGGGIRTRETIHHRLHTFQACAFNRSATPPLPARLAMRQGARNKPELEHIERAPAFGRRKGPVERGQVLVRQFQVKRAVVLTHMLEARGLWDHDHVLLAQQPREGHLRRRRAPEAGNFGERRVAQHCARPKRGVSHDRNPILAAPRDEIPFRAAAGQVVKHLVGRDAAAAPPAPAIPPYPH